MLGSTPASTAFRAMLYSCAANVALAHYPKTAGSALRLWFRESFPDAVAADPGDPHVSVRASLERLGLAAERRPRNRWRRLVRLVSGGRRLPLAEPDRKVFVIGVVREPFEMLVSLYEFWRRRFPERRHREGSLAYLAATADFRTFLHETVVNGRLANYHTFFDVGGPAWPRTRLLDFHSLAFALQAACREFGIQPPARLPVANVAPRTHDLAAYRDQAGPLEDAVRDRFRWYYEEAGEILIRGRQPTENPIAA